MRALFLILIFLSACGTAEMEMAAPVEADASQFEDALTIPATNQPPPPQDQGRAGGEQITKKIIKTGEMVFQSTDVEKDYKTICGILPKFHAYIENEDQSRSTYRINYSLTIRVEASEYDSLFSSLNGVSSRLDSKRSNVEDVTERYYDLKTRISNKKALEQRYIELLKKASEIKDILEIEKNINEIRTEIEQLEGQFNYLSKQVKFSTINLTFYEVLPYTYDPSQRKGFGARILSSLDNGWQGFLSFVVGLTSLWPLLILIAGGVFLFRKFRGRWKREKIEVKEQ